jgi:hypothetical protein
MWATSLRRESGELTDLISVISVIMAMIWAPRSAGMKYGFGYLVGGIPSRL